MSYWIEEQDRLGGAVWHGPILLEAREVANRSRIAAVRPNPVSGSAQLTYSLATAGHVLLSIHDVSGREVGRLVNESQDAGTHEVRWDPDRRNLAAGFYVIRFETGDTKEVRKVLLVR